MNEAKAYWLIFVDCVEVFFKLPYKFVLVVRHIKSGICISA